MLSLNIFKLLKKVKYLFIYKNKTILYRHIHNFTEISKYNKT